jgi:hypothetical protein
MLDGKRYYAHFPDEDPANNRILRRTSALIAAWRALKKDPLYSDNEVNSPTSFALGIVTRR